MAIVPSGLGTTAASEGRLPRHAARFSLESRGKGCSVRSEAERSSLIISKEVAMVRPHLKWLSVPLAFISTLGAWAAPADAGVIPWVYNAIFGPARNGPYGAMYGG